MAAGWVSLSLGFVGAFLPVLPTTPFVILAAYCFSKSSGRLHQWLLSRPRWGGLIRDWEQYGGIGKRAKITATVLIVALFSYTLIGVTMLVPIKGVLVVIGASVLLFIWTRPTPPTEARVTLETTAESPEPST